MYSSLRLVRHYLHYYLTSANGQGHGTHSPFVFDFILSVLNNRHHYDPPSELEALRRKLKADDRMLEVTDLGAGSRIRVSNKRTVSALAATALKPPKYARLLYRLVRHYRPQRILELGTSLGLTTAYFSRAHPGATIRTIEGSREIAAVAEENFRQLNCQNVSLLNGGFDEVLPAVLGDWPAVDLAYIDGNHRYPPTLRYFDWLLQKKKSTSIFVFDDIHWSSEMEAAWEEIKAHPAVTCSIDLFFLGLIFFREEFRSKQQFTIRF